MAKKNNNEIALSIETLNDFIWMSIRYCIGRKTIAAAMHAETIARILIHNRELIKNNKIEQIITDIRNEINYVLHCKNDVIINWFPKEDVFSKLCYAYKPNKKWVYEYSRGEIFINDNVKNSDDLPSIYYSDFTCDYIDIVPWVKLANLLDETCHKTFTVKDPTDGQIKECVCYPYPKRKDDGTFEEVWNDINDCLVTHTCYLSDEFIIK